MPRCGRTMFLYWKKRGAYELGALPPALAGMEYGAVERFSWSSSLDISEQLADEQCPAEEQGLRCQNPDCTDKRRAAKVGHGVPAVRLSARAVQAGRQQACGVGADPGRWRLPRARPGSQCLWCQQNRSVQLAGGRPWGGKPWAGRMWLGSREGLQPLPHTVGAVYGTCPSAASRSHCPCVPAGSCVAGV